MFFMSLVIMLEPFLSKFKIFEVLGGTLGINMLFVVMILIVVHTILYEGWEEVIK